MWRYLGLAFIGVAACGDLEGGIGETPALSESALKVCPAGQTVYGIDISKWQGDIDWAKVKADGVVYAFIRVSDGVNTFDSKFIRNWDEAKKNGILRGTYQYFRPDQDPIEQANLVLDNLATYGMGELPPVLDAEQSVAAFTPGADYQEPIGIWIAKIEDALQMKPIIYTGPSYWGSKVKTDAFKDYPLWNANWTSGCPTIPDQWANWMFWQYSATGSVDGIAGDVDLDKYNGSLADLHAYVASLVCTTNCPDARCDGVPDGTTLCLEGGQLGTCAGGRLSAAPCATACVATGNAARCVDAGCFAALGSDDGTYCVDGDTVGQCTDGVRTTRDCSGTQTCMTSGVGSACQAAPNDVTDTTTGDTGGTSVDTTSETTTDTGTATDATHATNDRDTTTDSGPDSAADGAIALPPGRQSSFTATEMPGSGCAGGGLEGLGGAWLLALGAIATRRYAGRRQASRD